MQQGGSRDLSVAERLKFWELVVSTLKAGFMIDIEFEQTMIRAVNPETVERILSFHDFEGISDDLGSILEAMSRSFCSAIKVAVVAEDATDSLAVWKLLALAEEKGKKVIPIAMGEAGKWTRILGTAHGAEMTYASLEAGRETAAGQITARDMSETYRVKSLTRETKVYGIIGDPVIHSLSPYFQNAAFSALNIDSVYVPFAVRDLDGFMTRMVLPRSREVELNFAGFSVTMPHKHNIMRYLDAIDPVAEKIGVVNTVRISNGKLTGSNTDADGFILPLKKRCGDLTDARVAVFGAGGAAIAAIFALRSEGARPVIFGRDVKRVNAIGEQFGVPSEPMYDDRGRTGPLTGFEIMVNATPLGMPGSLDNISLFSAEQLSGVKFVYDLVTRADDTPLIREAKKAGASTIEGFEMLIGQGVRQFEIWTGRIAPAEIMEAALNTALKERSR
jgi:3-dehydroquinate dehydratase/shikimate dehydrogenase